MMSDRDTARLTPSKRPLSAQRPLCRETTRRCVQKPAPHTLCSKPLAPSIAVFLSDIYLLTRLALSFILYYVIHLRPHRERSTP
jgi:hypothetical protein